METKVCSKCNLSKPISKYPSLNNKPNGSICRSCRTIYNLEYRHRKGICSPIGQNKDTTQYLGVYIAERVLSHYFKEITRMPYTNPGYDFICKRGFKIDAKSSCLRKNRPAWSFVIGKNIVADYFLCLGFDDRVSLTPLRVWLIPGNAINYLKVLWISARAAGLSKWFIYEKPIASVIQCCSNIKESSHE